VALSDASRRMVEEWAQFPYDRATFTFSGNTENKVLNDFKVDRK
jgi:hypothetical protein